MWWVSRINSNECYANISFQEHEYRVIQHGIEAEKALALESGSASFMEIFNKLNWRRTLAGCIGICSQWTAGAPIVFAYSTVRLVTIENLITNIN